MPENGGADKNGGVDKPLDRDGASVENELTDDDLDEMDGADGGQTTFPPYL